MTEPENLVLEQLRLMPADFGVMKDEFGHKLGAMAETLVSVKRDIHILQTQISSLEGAVHGVRQDVATLAIAVDEHTHRLDRIETRLNISDA